MKFLVVSNSKHLVPPDVMTDVIYAMKSWLQKYNEKIEQAWGFAGTQGGGGIIDVDSLEELDVIMTLVDLEPSLERLQLALQTMSSKG
jgi:hypothetical protein